MNTDIVVSIITFVGTLTGSYLANNKTTAIMQEQIKDLKEDINILSNRVDKHNNLIERMAKVEQSTKSAHHRLDNLQGIK